MATSAPAGPDPLSLVAASARRLVFGLGAAMATLDLLLPVALVVCADLQGRRYENLFWGEDNFITWFSSMQLLVIASAAFLNHHAAGLAWHLGRGEVRRRWIWLVFAAAFAFLAVDEILEFHEWLRDEVLEPGDWFANVPWMRPGDIGLYLYMGVGLVCAGFLLAELRRWRGALALFAAALGVAGTITVVDSLPPQIVRAWPWRDFWTSAFEETGELWAQALFLLSFLCVLHGRWRQIGGAAPTTREAS